MSHDTKVVCDRITGKFYVECSCEWESVFKPTMTLAREAEDEHLSDMGHVG